MSKVTVIGAGLVGTSIGVLLTARGHQVTIYEKRCKPAEGIPQHNRSINLAISERGWHTLDILGVSDVVKRTATPMYGRTIHTMDGGVAYQPYGDDGQCLYSVSRHMLNEVLLDLVEARNIPVRYGHECVNIDVDQPAALILNKETNEQQTILSDVIIGADGATSAVRKTAHFSHTLEHIDFGYKELTIPAGDGIWDLDKHSLHIWPRKQFMLIALPNADDTFTCTLFLPYSGSPSFNTVSTEEEVTQFFKTYFPDIISHVPGIVAEYLNNKDYHLYTVRCTPWHYQEKLLLLGDAAHGILPFFGQGANMGLEDCVVLDQLLETYNSHWPDVLPAYQHQRAPDCAAIATLSLNNFIEMRDRVADPLFLKKKEIEAHINKTFPDLWKSLYSMISFTRTPYAEAYKIGLQQDEVLERIMKIDNIAENWKELDYEAILRAPVSSK